jgi:hypothetical protein
MLDSISNIEVPRLSTSDTGMREQCKQTSLASNNPPAQCLATTYAALNVPPVQS